jgi:hypothetical protein
MNKDSKEYQTVQSIYEWIYAIENTEPVFKYSEVLEKVNEFEAALLLYPESSASRGLTNWIDFTKCYLIEHPDTIAEGYSVKQLRMFMGHWLKSLDNPVN